MVELTFAIYQAIRQSNPSICCYTYPPKVIDGEIVGLEHVGLNGIFDFIKLANALYGRIQ